VSGRSRKSDLNVPGTSALIDTLRHHRRDARDRNRDLPRHPIRQAVHRAGFRQQDGRVVQAGAAARPQLARYPFRTVSLRPRQRGPPTVAPARTRGWRCSAGSISSRRSSTREPLSAGAWRARTSTCSAREASSNLSHLGASARSGGKERGKKPSKIKAKNPRHGAPGGTRTPTSLRTSDFESDASTGSATGARANGGAS
jgi:hypothetical protein